jgi:hypothetical protein
MNGASGAGLPDGLFSNRLDKFWRALDGTMLIYFIVIRPKWH